MAAVVDGRGVEAVRFSFAEVENDFCGEVFVAVVDKREVLLVMSLEGEGAAEDLLSEVDAACVDRRRTMWSLYSDSSSVHERHAFVLVHIRKFWSKKRPVGHCCG